MQREGIGVQFVSSLLGRDQRVASGIVSRPGFFRGVFCLFSNIFSKDCELIQKT